MADTTSFPTAVSTNTANAANWFADNGSSNTNPTCGTYWACEPDITLSSFSSLSIPAGATIDGIEIIVEGSANIATANKPDFFVYNGSSWSSAKAANMSMAKRLVLYDPGWGASNDLWGLAWDATTAAAIQIKLDSSTIDDGSGKRMFTDFFAVRITYTR